MGNNEPAADSRRRPTGNQSNNPFRDCLEAARRGDPAALGALSEQIRNYLLLIANRELPSDLHRKIGASDVVQETFVQVQRKLGEFRGDTEQELLAWTRRILLNGIHDIRRHYQAGPRRAARERPLAGDSVNGVPPIDPAMPDADPESLAIDSETVDSLRVAIRRLPEDYQQVLRWRTWEQLSFVEVGAKMNRSADAVRMLWKRAVGQLQAELDSADGDG